MRLQLDLKDMHSHRKHLHGLNAMSMACELQAPGGAGMGPHGVL